MASRRLRSECSGECAGESGNVGRRGHGRGHHFHQIHDHDEFVPILTERVTFGRVSDQTEQKPVPTLYSSPKKSRSFVWSLAIPILLFLALFGIVCAANSESGRSAMSYVGPIVDRTLDVSQFKRIFSFFTPAKNTITSLDIAPRRQIDIEQLKELMAAVQARLSALEDASKTYYSPTKTEKKDEFDTNRMRSMLDTLDRKIEKLSAASKSEIDLDQSDLSDVAGEMSKAESRMANVNGDQRELLEKMHHIGFANDQVNTDFVSIRSRIDSTTKTDCSACSAIPASPDHLSVEDINGIVSTAIAKYDADKTGLADFALESSGGQILGVRCTESYSALTRQESLFGIPLWYKDYSPRTVIQSGFAPGECWAFKGSHGFLTIKLSGIINVTAVSYEHIHKDISPTGNIESAPNLFEVHALANENDEEGLCLGKFKYDANGPPLQVFPVQVTDAPATEIVELRIMSNYGHPVYTCLYRFRVHGRRVEPNYAN